MQSLFLQNLMTFFDKNCRYLTLGSNSFQYGLSLKYTHGPIAYHWRNLEEKSFSWLLLGKCHLWYAAQQRGLDCFSSICASDWRYGHLVSVRVVGTNALKVAKTAMISIGKAMEYHESPCWRLSRDERKHVLFMLVFQEPMDMVEAKESWW